MVCNGTYTYGKKSSVSSISSFVPYNPKLKLFYLDFAYLRKYQLINFELFFICLELVK